MAKFSENRHISYVINMSCKVVKFMSSGSGKVYVEQSSLGRLVKFMSSGQIYVDWSNLCRMVKVMSNGQVYV